MRPALSPAFRLADFLSLCRQKAENELGEAEQVVDRQTRMIEDLTRNVSFLPPSPSPQASERLSSEHF